jgi:hypothetical protein
LNNDGSEDLIMGAPVYSKLNALQNGAVFIQLAQSKSGKLPFRTINLEEKADLILNPPEEAVSSRFGHDITVLDLNQDGLKDIVVSAPSFGLQNITYQVFYSLFIKIDNSFCDLVMNIFIANKGHCVCLLWSTEQDIFGGAVNKNHLSENKILQSRMAIDQRRCQRRWPRRFDHQLAVRKHRLRPVRSRLGLVIEKVELLKCHRCGQT